MGKTALLQKLAEDDRLKRPVVVVSADSVQAYRGLDIGSAKPSAAEQKTLPHLLIDILDPSENYSLGTFVRLADEACEKVCASGGLPVLSGGTAYYVKAFLYGPVNTPKADPSIREEVKQAILKNGIAAAYQELSAIDPGYAAKIAPQDSYRIARAIEVYKSSGRPLSSYALPQSLRAKWDCLVIGLDRPREELYSRIDQRVELMFEAGLAEELKSLVDKGCRQNDPGMKAIGYSEFFASGNVDTVKEEIKKHTRQYAKRQLTFMRSFRNMLWAGADDYKTVTDSILAWLQEAFVNKT